jgi:DNA-binding CsgD family transcriptional regulator
MKALEPEFLSLIISDIYDCALDANRWSQTLTRITQTVNGAYTTISLSDPHVAIPRMAANSPWDEVRLKILNEEFGLDGVPGLREVFVGDLDTPRSTLDQMGEDVFQQSRFYQEWVKPQGLRDGCVVKFAHTHDRIGALAFITRADRDVITADERRFIALLSPHVRRAAMISDLLNLERVQAQHFEQALNRVASAVVLVDASEGMLYANAQASAMLTAGLNIKTSNGKLTSANSNTAPALSDAIARTAGSAFDLGGRGIGIPVSAPGKPPAIAYVLPMVNGDRRGVFPTAVAAVFISSTATSLPPPSDVLATLYDMTPTEARVMLQAGQGHGIANVASVLGMSENTVKTHLARVFHKTGTSRQSEIVALISALAQPATAPQSHILSETS